MLPVVLIQLGAPEAVKATVWLNRSVWSPSFVGSQIMNLPSPPSGRLAKKEKPEIVVVVDTDTPWPKPSSEGPIAYSVRRAEIEDHARMRRDARSRHRRRKRGGKKFSSHEDPQNQVIWRRF